MAHNSNSHDAPWLPNTQTEMFSVYAGNARSSRLVVGAVASCFTHVGRRTETLVTKTVGMNPVLTEVVELQTPNWDDVCLPPFMLC